MRLPFIFENLLLRTSPSWLLDVPASHQGPQWSFCVGSCVWLWYQDPVGHRVSVETLLCLGMAEPGWPSYCSLSVCSPVRDGRLQAVQPLLLERFGRCLFVEVHPFFLRHCTLLDYRCSQDSLILVISVLSLPLSLPPSISPSPFLLVSPKVYNFVDTFEETTFGFDCSILFFYPLFH